MTETEYQLAMNCRVYNSRLISEDEYYRRVDLIMDGYIVYD